MSNAGKNRRIEELFSEADRQRMLWLIDNEYGIEAVMERFGLTEMAATEYLDAERAKRRAKERAGTDWAARFAEFRAAG